jgi:SAM-dependent methyltransferase
MLARARQRLGAVVALSDAMAMAIGTASVAHAVSVWVVHSVADPVRLFAETARVIRPGGKYVVCSIQRPADDDAIGNIVREMTLRIEARRHAPRPRAVSSAEVLTWAGEAGFTGSVHEVERRWYASPSAELAAIAYRTWPALRELDEAAVEDVTRPAIDALEALPTTECLRRAVAEMVVLDRP